MLEILAQTVPTTSPANEPSGLMQFIYSPLFPVVVALLLFTVISSRNRRKQEKERESLLNNLKKNDRIQTIGGILGTVISADAQEVVVKVDETNNTKIRFVRSAILKVITEETKTETK